MTNPESTGRPSATTSPRYSGGATWSRLGMDPTPPWTPDGPRDLKTALAPAEKPLPVTSTMYDQIEPAPPEPESPVLAAVTAANDPAQNVVVELRPAADVHEDVVIAEALASAPPSRRGWLRLAIHRRFE